MHKKINNPDTNSHELNLHSSISNPYGKFFIVNDYDRPSERMIMQLKKDGKIHYINPEFAKYTAFNLDEATAIEKFGLQLKIENGFLHGELTSESSATYKDGRSRRWQGSKKFTVKILL